jgi:hypothetical protein
MRASRIVNNYLDNVKFELFFVDLFLRISLSKQQIGSSQVERSKKTEFFQKTRFLTVFFS